jgi:long-subunit acyl-CoA synthetase (AMP-forming)
MDYNFTDLTRSPKEVFNDVIGSSTSQLLIPPNLTKYRIKVAELRSELKSIGLFSSGTTATPKCIWNTFENLKLNAKRTAKAFDIKSSNRILMLAKPWHVAGLSWAIMVENLGCEYEFITTHKGESIKWLEAIHRFKPDYLLTVPPVFRALYNESWEVEHIVTGGIPLAKSDLEPLRKHCKVIYQGYGQTEAGGLISVLKKNILEKVEIDLHRNCGTPIEGVELQTKGSAENPLDVYIRSETANNVGFYNSGDVGYLKNGMIYLSGRKEIIVSRKD